MLKKALLGILVLVFALAAYIFQILSTTGFFREIENKPYGSVYQEISLIGAEDLTVDYEAGVMVISAFDRAGTKREENPTGGIYMLDLNQEPFEPVRLDDGLGDGFHPHGISLFKKDSGSYRLLVVNHQKGKHSLELFDLDKGELTHLQTYQDEKVISPNDVVLVGADKFYFTNDHGNTSKVGVFFENYMGLKASGVVYHDGTSYSDVAGDIAYANGINVSPDLKKLYVAAPRQFEVLEYDISTDGSLDGPKVITTGTGVDNLEWDDAGNLWSGAHPNLIAFTTYASLKADSAPSEVVKIKFPDVSVESVYVDDGSQISASSVAVPYKNFLFIGNVLDDRLLVLRK